MNIYEKLSAISNELMTVAKNLEVGYGSNKYKAVSEGDVLKAIKPLEEKHKVYSYPYSRKIIESGVVENVNSKGEVKKNLFERIETIYRFVNMEDPKEYVDITSYGDGIDSQDKSVGKAMTYADKYALLKAYKIVTGDDPDQDPSEDLKSVKKDSKPTSNKPTEETLAKAKEIGLKLEGVATYFKKKVEDLTEEEIRACLERKLQAMKNKEIKDNGTN